MIGVRVATGKPSIGGCLCRTWGWKVLVLKLEVGIQGANRYLQSSLKNDEEGEIER